jgi:hypothetical protein
LLQIEHQFLFALEHLLCIGIAFLRPLVKILKFVILTARAYQVVLGLDALGVEELALLECFCEVFVAAVEVGLELVEQLFLGFLFFDLPRFF